MGVTTDGDGNEGLALAFELAALERLARPADVFADAREWSRYVGVIANHPADVRAFLREHDLRHDFELGDRDKWLALQEVRAATDAPRYVFVGTDGDDRLAAEQTGWEFVPLAEAAEKAGWARGEAADSPGGLLARLRALLAGD